MFSAAFADVSQSSLTTPKQGSNAFPTSSAANNNNRNAIISDNSHEMEQKVTVMKLTINATRKALAATKLGYFANKKLPTTHYLLHSRGLNPNSLIQSTLLFACLCCSIHYVMR